MKTYFVKGLKTGAFIVIGVGYIVACYCGWKALSYPLEKKLLL